MPGAIGWAPALLPSRGGVIAHPKVQSRNSDSARCDWEIKEVAEAALLPVAPTLRSGKLDRPVKYRFFRRCDILAIRDHLVGHRVYALGECAVQLQLGRDGEARG